MSLPKNISNHNCFRPHALKFVDLEGKKFGVQEMKKMSNNATHLNMHVTLFVRLTHNVVVTLIGGGGLLHSHKIFLNIVAR